MKSFHSRVVDHSVIICCPYIPINVFIKYNCFMQYSLHKSGLLSQVKWIERAICHALYV
jgi:hypothetical protein